MYFNNTLVYGKARIRNLETEPEPEPEAEQQPG